MKTSQIDLILNSHIDLIRIYLNSDVKRSPMQIAAALGLSEPDVVKIISEIKSREASLEKARAL